VQGYLDNPGCGLRSIADSGTITNYFACFPQAAAVAARQGVGPKKQTCGWPGGHAGAYLLQHLAKKRIFVMAITSLAHRRR
jgi:hypothetical protein